MPRVCWQFELTTETDIADKSTWQYFAAVASFLKIVVGFTAVRLPSLSHRG